MSSHSDSTEPVTDVVFTGDWKYLDARSAINTKPRLEGAWTFVFEGIRKRISTEKAQSIAELSRQLRGQVPASILSDVAALLWSKVPKL
jgi:hypothetical protein